MNFVSIGDLAQSMQLRRDNSRLNADMQRLTSELSSGRVGDIRSGLGGDFGPLASLERSMQTLSAFRTSGREAALFTEVAQSILETVQTTVVEVMPALILTRTSSQPSQIAAIGSDASQKLGAIISSLNKEIGGRTLFAGDATDGPALISADLLLDQLETAVAGATTAADVQTIVSNWFAVGADFDTVAYTGSASTLRPFRLSESESVAFGTTARDEGIRNVLEGMALAALLDRGVLSGLPEERADLAIRAGDTLIPAQDRLVELRARVGDAQAGIDRALARTEAEMSATELARGDLVKIDPFKAATELQSVQSQLETLYTLTARMSRLSLAEYLR